jgi:tetratricopeptide (TPR) repeat protein
MGGPLDHPELREVEQLLDAREVAEAQALLSTLGERKDMADGVAYLTTRLLHVRGKLDWPAVADRLRDILARSPDFSEASALLFAAERGRVQSQSPATAKEGQPLPVVASRLRAEHDASVAPVSERALRADPHSKTAPDPASQRAGWLPDGPRPARSSAPLNALRGEPRTQTPSTLPVSGKPLPPQMWDAEGPTPVLDFESTAHRAPLPPHEAGAVKPTQPPHTPRLGSGAPPALNAQVEAQRRRLFTPLSGFDAFPNSRQEGPEPGPRGRRGPGGDPGREQGDVEVKSAPANPGMPVIPRAPALPQFHENPSAPSYAPGRNDDIDFVRSKSLLPRNAGRYSEMPASTDVIEPSIRRKPPKGPLGPNSARQPNPLQQPHSARQPNSMGQPHSAPNPPVTAREGRGAVRRTPERIVSGQPPKNAAAGPAPMPTLFEIASWIDQGRHRDAIAAINRAGADTGPEYSVLRARALAGAGYVDQAFDALERLEHARNLDPELKAACARLFVELGAPARALPLAREARDADPERPLVQLTFALAAVRAARRDASPDLLDRAARALERVQGREGPHPALFQALRACVEAATGDPERAISMAQRALGLDSRSPDALAAIAEASARAGRAHGAKQAWTRLAEISLDEADAVEGALANLGIPVGAHEGEPKSLANTDGTGWVAVEVSLAAGKRTEAARAIELSAHEAVRRMTKSASQNGPTAIATVAATFLTTSPVFSSFAPYDMSLWSLRRLEAAIDVLYGAERRQRGPADDAGIVLLMGSYIGEAMRLGHDGHWEGNVSDLDTVRVLADKRHFYPFRVLTARLRQGRRASIGEALATTASRPGESPWRARTPNPIAPPVPWAPSAWPKPSEIGRLGRSIGRSPIGKFCEDCAEGSLDRTTTSLIALDTYLELIAPRSAPPDPDAAWTRRIAVFAGGYLGETLRGLVGGEWVYGVDSADDALAFKLHLRGSVEAMPVAHVLERVIGQRTSSLVDYAKTMMRRAGRV